MSNEKNTKISLFKLLREDVYCVFQRDPAARNMFEVLTTYPGVHALIHQRIANRLWIKGWQFSARLIAYFSRLITNIDIHPGASIGRRFFIDHGAGVVIGETAEIGNDVTLYHGVTLGGTSWNKGKRHPTLNDHVMIGAGAKILGPITLGEKVRVGANSVVIHDIEADRTVVGIPGKEVNLHEVGEVNPYGIDLNHHLIPDPIGKAINCLVNRIEDLESQLKHVSEVAHDTAQIAECDECEANVVCETEQTSVHDNVPMAAGVR